MLLKLRQRHAVTYLKSVDQPRSNYISKYQQTNAEQWDSTVKMRFITKMTHMDMVRT